MPYEKDKNKNTFLYLGGDTVSKKLLLAERPKRNYQAKK